MQRQIVLQRHQLTIRLDHPFWKRAGQIDREVVPVLAVPLEVDLPDADERLVGHGILPDVLRFAPS